MPAAFFGRTLRVLQAPNTWSANRQDVGLAPQADRKPPCGGTHDVADQRASPAPANTTLMFLLWSIQGVRNTVISVKYFN